MMLHNVNNNQVYRLNSGLSPPAVNPCETSYKSHNAQKLGFIGHIFVADS